MNENIEEFEDEEDLESEMENAEEAEAKPKVKTKKKVEVKGQTSEQEIQGERFQALHQQEVVAIVDTLTGEPVAEGFTDRGMLQVCAKMLNILEKISNATGA